MSKLLKRALRIHLDRVLEDKLSCTCGNCAWIGHAENCAYIISWNLAKEEAANSDNPDNKEG